MLDRVCLITFSNNTDYQDMVYGLYHVLEPQIDVYTVGLSNPKSSIAPHTEKNLYVDGPLRPGIEAKTFRVDLLFKIASFIRKNKIRYIYFESQHLWNVPVMILCKGCIRIQAVHDVIPHDGNRMMDLSNFFTSHLADHVILRNTRFKKVFEKRCQIREEKITCMNLWKTFPKEEGPKIGGPFLCFGRIRRYKGFDLLQKVVEQCPEIPFQIVGEPDEESKPLVEQLKLYKNVEVVDREVTSYEMIAYIRNASWLLLPYSSGTQSGVIMDAYRFSKPVIAFDVGAICEQVEDGVSGFLIPSGDVEKFAEMISKTSKFTEEKMAQFAHNAYQVGYEKYSIEIAAENFLNLLGNI